MRLRFKKKTDKKRVSRLKSRARIRKKVEGTPERPRLCVYKGGKNMYAQLVDDLSGKTLASASTLKSGKAGSNKDAAAAVGAEIAKKAIDKNVKEIVFDRSGYVYHGRIKALAEAAREAGLKF